MKVYFSTSPCGLIPAPLIYSLWVLVSSSVKQNLVEPNSKFLCSEVLWFYDNMFRYLFQICREYSWQYFNLYLLNFSLNMSLYQVFNISKYL